MDKKVYTCLIIFFLEVVYIQAQIRFEDREQTYIFTSSFTKIGSDYWASGGAAISEYKGSAAAINNPAGLYYNKFNTCTEFGKWSTSDWIADFKRNGHYVLPSYISIGIPFKKFMTAIGYSNYYHSILKARMEITTLEQPQGTGRYIDAEKTIRLSTFFGSCNYLPNERVSFGLTIGLNHLAHKDKIHKIEASGESLGYSLITGIILRPIKNLKIGYKFTYVSDVKYDIVIEPEPEVLVQVNADSNVSRNNPNISSNYLQNSFPYIAKFPYLFETGLSYNIFKFITLLGKVELQKWRYDENETIDVVNYHLGSRFHVSNRFILSIGYFTQYEPGEYDYISYVYPDQKFITFGVSLRLIDSLSATACILDSHILKESDRVNKYLQTYYSFGMSLRL